MSSKEIMEKSMIENAKKFLEEELVLYYIVEQQNETSKNDISVEFLFKILKTGEELVEKYEEKIFGTRKQKKQILRLRKKDFSRNKEIAFNENSSMEEIIEALDEVYGYLEEFSRLANEVLSKFSQEEVTEKVLEEADAKAKQMAKELIERANHV